MNKLYTMGYSHWSIDQLDSELERLGALLVDVRLNPYSSRPEWCKEALRTRFGKNYIWAGALGNRNYRGGPIELAAQTGNWVDHSPSPWFFGLYGLQLRSPEAFDKPIPARGQLGLWGYEVMV